MTSQYRKPLTENIDFYDVRQAVEDVKAGSYDGLPYTSKVLAEQLVRRAEPEKLADYLGQLINREQTLDFPWYPARVVCHDVQGKRHWLI